MSGVLDSFIESKRLLIGTPASIEITVRPLNEAEIVGRGFDAPEWIGKLEIRSIKKQAAEPLYSMEVGGLKLSTAEFKTGLLPSSQCLWLVYEAHGWSDPHCTSLNGVLLKLVDGKLLPIWNIELLEECRGNGMGGKKTAEYKFSKSKDGVGPPTISVTNLIWAKTLQELDYPGGKPERLEGPKYIYDGEKFVIQTRATSPAPN